MPKQVTINQTINIDELAKQALLFGRPDVQSCPSCGTLHLTTVDMFESSAFCCEACNGNIVHFDYVKADAVDANQKEFRYWIIDRLNEIIESQRLSILQSMVVFDGKSNVKKTNRR